MGPDQKLVWCPVTKVEHRSAAAEYSFLWYDVCGGKPHRAEFFRRLGVRGIQFTGILGGEDLVIPVLFAPRLVSLLLWRSSVPSSAPLRLRFFRHADVRIAVNEPGGDRHPRQIPYACIGRDGHGGADG